jgi:hypothetical protein
MDLLHALLNKLLVVLFFMACLNTFRHAYYLLGTYIQSTPDEPRKYFLSDKTLIVLSISIGYILSVIFTGIQI